MASLFETGTFSTTPWELHEQFPSKSFDIYEIERTDKGWITISFNCKKIRRKIKIFNSFDDYSGIYTPKEYVKYDDGNSFFSSKLYKKE